MVLPTEEESPEEKKDKTSTLLSPEGLLMLSVGGILDILSIIGAILILAFGFGLLFAKIVYIVGWVIVGAWAFFRSGKLPVGKTGKLPVGGKGTSVLDQLFGGFKFFGQFLKGFGAIRLFGKRQWPKLLIKAIPFFGDIFPFWTWTIISEIRANR